MIGSDTSPPRHRVVAVIVPGDGPHLVALPAALPSPSAHWRSPRFSPAGEAVTSLPLAHDDAGMDARTSEPLTARDAVCGLHREAGR